MRYSRSNRTLRITLTIALVTTAAHPQSSVCLKPSIRPFLDHPFQAQNESLYSSYQTSLGRIEWTLQEMKRAGVQIARLEIPWLVLEPAIDGQYAWERTDLILHWMESYEIDLLATFVSCPFTSGSRLTTKLHPAATPDLIDFIRAFLDRYPGRVPYVEIGNEPTQIYFSENQGWGRNDFAYFTEMLVPASMALRQSHPAVKILNAGELHRLPDTLFQEVFIPSLGRTEKPADWIDVFSVHYVESFGEFFQMRQRLDAEGYAHVPIWLTECDYFDSWGNRAWGFRDLVAGAYPHLVQQFFKYTSVDGYFYRVDPQSGYRYERYDDGGILTYWFNREHQNYRDFTAVSGGPFSLGGPTLATGLSWNRFDRKVSDPGAPWHSDLILANLGDTSHEARVEFSGSLPPMTVTLPGDHGRTIVDLSGTRPVRDAQRIEMLARSLADGRHADMNRVLLKAPKGEVLNHLAQYDPQFAPLFDEDPTTSIVTIGQPLDVVLDFGKLVRIEELEILTDAGDLVDIASSYIELAEWDGAEWNSFGSCWARELREHNGPEPFFIIEDGESIPELPLVARSIRFRFWQRAKVATINVVGNPAPSNAPPRVRLRYTAPPDPFGDPRGWILDGWIHDPDGFIGALANASLELDGPTDVLFPLARLDATFGPLPFFQQSVTWPATYRFTLHGSVGLPPGRHSLVLRTSDRQGRQDFDLVTIHQKP